MLTTIYKHKLKVILFAAVILLGSWFYFSSRAAKEPPEKADLVYNVFFIHEE